MTALAHRSIARGNVRATCHHIARAVALFGLLVGCKATYPEGKIACEAASDCPSGWSCVQQGTQGRCYSPGAAPADGAVGDGSAPGGDDAGRMDAASGTDAGPTDGDSSTAMDGGGDGGQPEGGVDPCDTDNGGCDSLVKCSSKGSTVTCGNCPDGYDDVHSDGTKCTDIDECASDNGGCGDATRYSCTNETGGEPTCKDIDECGGGAVAACGTGATDCDNEDGSYVCACDTGYSGTGSKACADLDACFGATCASEFPCVDLTAPSLDYTCRGQFVDWAVGAPTLVDNGDGTVTDSRSGLLWQQTLDAGTYTWADAQVYCDGLSLGGTSAWRTPTKAELESIVKDTTYNPSIHTTFFPGTPNVPFWTATSSAAGGGVAWTVNFGSGTSDKNNMTSTANRVRCVR